MLSSQIAEQPVQILDFKPHILCLTLTQFEQAATINPFHDAQCEPINYKYFSG
jgi:hypothetical protein